MRKRLLLGCPVFVGLLAAQMTPDQRVQEFENLTALYAKRYAPFEWKRDAIGFDLFDVARWMERVRKATDDLEYYEIALEYVATLQDTHSWYRVPSSFSADLGFTLDIYDGKVLIDSIDRARLPESNFNFHVGDELISVDDKTAEEWILALSRFRKRGNPAATRRAAADLITFRAQSVVPRAVELSDAATVVIRRDNGALESYTIAWIKTGAPLTRVGPVPSPDVRKADPRSSSEESQPSYLTPLLDMRNWSLPYDDHLLQGKTTSAEAADVPRRYVLGIGSRIPVFRAGLPSSFVQRLGRAPTDFHYSGTYEAEGYKIGFLRVPTFAPLDAAVAMRELETEVDFFQKNTDGLVVDVMRNPGGGCYMADLAAHLIPYNFYFFGQEIRATRDHINSLQFAIETAKRARADQWIIDTYQVYLDQINQAYLENRGRTGSIAACNQFRSEFPPSTLQLPASVVYTKSLITLVDEFSSSAADIFPAMMQDNGRGLIVGTRTSGAGGSVSAWPVGFYSEAFGTNTDTLVVRKQPVVTEEYPTAPYIENIGVRPDVSLDYMTRENLLNGGQTFVGQFTRILVDEIRKASQ